MRREQAEGEQAEISSQVPSEGCDVQNEPVYWILPDGRAVSWSLLEIVSQNMDELVDPTARSLLRDRQGIGL